MLKKIEKIIDVHQHIFPDFYVKTLNNLGIANVGGVPFPKWSEKAALKTMDTMGINKAFVSYSMPGVYFKDDRFSRELARKCNEYMAEMKLKYPTRFGGFAALPLPDVDGALKELEYAMDTLNLDGVGLLSNVDGVYPAAEKYRDLFSELNRRESVIFIHPNNSPSKLTTGLHNILYGWFIETSKVVMEIAKTGFVTDFPRICYILAHAGGVYPAFPHLLKELKDPILKGNFFFDTAKSVDSFTLNLLLSIVEVDHLLFGSDFPLANKMKIKYWLKGLVDYFDGRENDLIDIFSNNVRSLFPNINSNSKER